MSMEKFIIKRGSDKSDWVTHKLNTEWTLPRVREELSGVMLDSDLFTYSDAKILSENEAEYILAEINEGNEGFELTLLVELPEEAEPEEEYLAADTLIKLVNSKNKVVIRFDQNKSLAELRSHLSQSGKINQDNNFYHNNSPINRDDEADTLVSDILTEDIEIFITNKKKNSLGDAESGSDFSEHLPEADIPEYSLTAAEVDTNATDDMVVLPDAALTEEIFRYEDLDNDEKTAFVHINNLDRGVRLLDAGLGVSDTAIIRRKSLPQITKVRETLDFKTMVTHSQAVHEIRKAGVKKANASIGVKGISIGGNWSESRESLSRTDSLTVWFLATRDVPKIRLSFTKPTEAEARDQVSDHFRNAIGEAVSGNDSLRTYIKLLKVLNEWGHYLPLTFVLGGQIIAEEKKTVTGKTEAESLETSFGAAAEAKVVIKGVPVDAAGGYAQSDASTESSSSQHTDHAINITVRGGDPAAFSDHAAWIATLGPVMSWTIIEYDDLIPTINLLEEKLSTRCAFLINKYCLSPDTAKTTAVDMSTYIGGVNKDLTAAFF